MNDKLILFSVIVKDFHFLCWKSKCGDKFVVGIDTPNGQFGLPADLEYWDMFDCKEVETTPEFNSDITKLLGLTKEIAIKYFLDNYKKIPEKYFKMQEYNRGFIDGENAKKADEWTLERDRKAVLDRLNHPVTERNLTFSQFIFKNLFDKKVYPLNEMVVFQRLKYLLGEK